MDHGDVAIVVFWVELARACAPSALVRRKAHAGATVTAAVTLGGEAATVVVAWRGAVAMAALTALVRSVAVPVVRSLAVVRAPWLTVPAGAVSVTLMSAR